MLGLKKLYTLNKTCLKVLTITKVIKKIEKESLGYMENIRGKHMVCLLVSNFQKLGVGKLSFFLTNITINLLENSRKLSICSCLVISMTELSNIALKLLEVHQVRSFENLTHKKINTFRVRRKKNRVGNQKKLPLP